MVVIGCKKSLGEINYLEGCGHAGEIVTRASIWFFYLGTICGAR
jgi:hypothetical protein